MTSSGGSAAAHCLNRALCGEFLVSGPLAIHDGNDPLNVVYGIRRPVVLAAREFIHMVVKGLLAHLVTCSVITTLEKRPDALDSVCT